MQTFTMRGAQPNILLIGIGMASVVEAVVLHLVLAARYPWIAYPMEVVGVLAFVQMWRLFGSLAGGRVTVSDDTVEIHAGRMAHVAIPRALILDVVKASWTNLPQKGTAEADGYVNVTGPSEPALLLTLREPVPVRIMGLVTKSAHRIAVFVDQAHDLRGLLSVPDR
ncbi:MAG: hypothetical protein K2R93_20285 [Gemmatimonadaceae bacterium]|nr:hypothetical protein [Gemmatimonadaceae bacterium]